MILLKQLWSLNYSLIVQKASVITLTKRISNKAQLSYCCIQGPSQYVFSDGSSLSPIISLSHAYMPLLFRHSFSISFPFWPHHSAWGTSLTSNQVCGAYSGSTESLPLDCQGSSRSQYCSFSNLVIHLVKQEFTEHHYGPYIVFQFPEIQIWKKYCPLSPTTCQWIQGFLGARNKILNDN